MKFILRKAPFLDSSNSFLGSVWVRGKKAAQHDNLPFSGTIKIIPPIFEIKTMSRAFGTGKNSKREDVCTAVPMESHNCFPSKAGRNLFDTEDLKHFIRCQGDMKFNAMLHKKQQFAFVIVFEPLYVD